MTELLYRGPNNIRSVFSNTDAHPLLLDLTLIRTFKADYLLWEPETVWHEIDKTFNTSISEVNKAKVHGLRTCHLVDRPFEAWEVFEKVAIAFNNSIPLFNVMQQPSPQSCAFTVEAMAQIRSKALSEEVVKYIASVFLDNGFIYAPSPLDKVNPHIETLLHKQGKLLAGKVKMALTTRKTPHMDSTREEDIQLAKSLSISDYVAFMEKRLYTQLQRVFKEN